MNSLPFSINAYYNPINHGNSSLRRSFNKIRNLQNTVDDESSSVLLLKFGRSEENQNRLASSSSSSANYSPLVNRSRREAVGFSLCFSFFELLNPLQLNGSYSIAAEDSQSCEFVEASNGLAYCDKVVGTGPEAVKGQLIKAHYVGKLEDGKMFDSSYNRGKPLTFRVGVGEVIKGWDQGILGGDGIPPMLAGGKRKLKIPPELAYGVRGAGCRGGSCIIPPNSVLLFDVEFVGKAA